MKHTNFFERIFISVCDSTNAEAWKRFEKKSPLLIVADHQLKGRGRLGRSWISDSENINLLATYIFQPDFHHSSWVPLIAGIAVWNSLQKFKSNEPKIKLFAEDFWIKWPNDIYSFDSKIGGILCESKIQGDKIQAILIGIGLNLFSEPNLSDRNTNQVFSFNHSPTIEEQTHIRDCFLDLLEKELLYLIDLLKSENFEKCRNLWIEASQMARFGEFEIHPKSNGPKIKIRIKDLNLRGNLIAERYDPASQKWIEETYDQPLE